MALFPKRSIDQTPRLARVFFRGPLPYLVFILLGPFCLLPETAGASWPGIHFRAAEVRYGERLFEQVEVSIQATGDFQLGFRGMAGPGAELAGSDVIIAGRLDPPAPSEEETVWSGNLEARGWAARFRLQDRPEALLLRLEAEDQPLTMIRSWPGIPAEASWLKQGLIRAELDWRQAVAGPAETKLRIAARQVSFDSPDGQFAGEALQFDVSGDWTDTDESAYTVNGRIVGGELLLGDFYRDFNGTGLDFDAEARSIGELLEIPRFSLGDDVALRAVGRAQLSLGSAPGGWSLQLSELQLDFPAAYQRYIEPMAAAWTLNGLTVTGRIHWSGEWQSGNLRAGDLRVEDLSIVDTRRGRFAFTGLDARLRPGDHDFNSRLAWRGLLLGRINLGPGQAALDSEPGTVALIEPLQLDVMGGRLELTTLKAALPGSRVRRTGEPDLLLRARIDQLDMGRLTAALDWPPFDGVVSGEIPGVSLQDGVLGVDGEIRFDVFGGRIALQNLSMERLFGVLPGLAADIRIDDLDLEQLTRTFSFGRIAGRLDGQINDLRLLNWKPVAFDAWVGTPARQAGSNDISKQAVNRLTTIGGGSPTAALTGPLMRMFSSFSYRRLGLGCRLQNNVCELRGLSEDEGSVLILEGAGVPKVTIRAYNRRIDWPQMVSNLLAIATEPAAETEGP